MGAWGVGLYQDDTAADLRDIISLIAKIPAEGDRLLKMLLETQGEHELTDDGGPTFWLVIADQFERRGIRSRMAFERALLAIDSGLDLKDLENRGEDAKGLSKRKSILDRLAQRIRSPRPERILPKNPRLPDAVVGTGDVYAFPTMAGLAFASYVSGAEDFDRRNFKQDGWGAVVVVDQGRAFDWLPWCALISVAVDPSKMPTIPDLFGAELLYHSQTKGATRCVPKRSELKDVPFQLIGKVELDKEAIESIMAKWPSAEESIQLGWPLRTVAFGRNSRFSLPKGPSFSTLVARK